MIAEQIDRYLAEQDARAKVTTDAAIERGKVPSETKAAIYEMLVEIAKAYPEFSTDHLWALAALREFDLGSASSVIGSVMRKASDDGVIAHIGWVNSRRPEHHRRPIRKWRSNGLSHS